MSKNIETKKKRKRADGTGTITKCSDGYWRGKVQIGTGKDGLPIMKSFSGKSEKIVKEKIRAYIGNKPQQQRDVWTKDSKEYLDESIRNWAMQVKKNTLKKESFSRLISIIENQINPRIGHYVIPKLTPQLIQEELINDMFDQSCSQSSIKKAYSALNDFMNYWRKLQLLKTQIFVPNIMELVEIPSIHQFNSKEIKAMQDDEVTRFLDLLHIRNTYGDFVYEMHALIDLIIQTGLRLGEACALKIEDYNADEKSLFIRRNVIETNDIQQDANGEIFRSRRFLEIQESLKTTSGHRKIPLNSDAIRDIESLIDRAKKIAPQASYVAISTNGRLVWPSNIVKTINRIFKHANLPYSGAHVLRHTYATALFAQGIELKIISSFLGHSSIQITSQTYVHFLESLKFKDTSSYMFRPYPVYLLQQHNNVAI